MNLNFSNHLFQWTHNLKRYYSWQHLSLENSWTKLRNHMEDNSINGLVESLTSLFKLSMIFNISPGVSVDIWTPQQNLLSLVSNMEWNISCTIHMNLTCTQERTFTKHMKSHINVSFLSTCYVRVGGAWDIPFHIWDQGKQVLLGRSCVHWNAWWYVDFGLR